MRTKPAKTHLPTLAAVLLLSVGFILIGMTAAPQASAQPETSQSACSER
jgi:hypothetical protein